MPPKTSSPSNETPVDIITHQPVLASSSTFQLTWPAGEQPHIPSLPQGSTFEYPQPLSQQAQAHPQVSNIVPNPFFDNLPLSAMINGHNDSDDSPMTHGAGPATFNLQHPPPERPPPRFARAFSTPLPQQLKHLRHPSQRRNVQETVIAPTTSLPRAPAQDHYAELGLELADSVQMVIQTLIQISPPHLLDPAKEQLAGYTLQLPTPSVSALLTTMKNLNYMSANLSTLSSPGPPTPEPADAVEIAAASSIKAVDMDKLTSDGRPILSTEPNSIALDDFDVGEVLQSAGDVLSGVAAQAGVDLVLFHADVGMKHVNVKGDECGISYSLCHVIRQVLVTCQNGDELEVGLYISAPHAPRLRRADSGASDASDNSPPSPSFSSLSTLNSDEPVMCTFEITHKFAQSMNKANPTTNETSEPHSRPAPQFNTGILQRLLAHVKATLQTDVVTRSAIVATSSSFGGASQLLKSSRTVELSVMLTPGPPSDPFGELDLDKQEEVDTGAYRQPYGDEFKVATEPTLDDLAAFVALDAKGGGLKGKKAVFHACEMSSFAHHLTSYLTAWGMDVSHCPTNGEVPDGSKAGLQNDEPQPLGGSEDEEVRLTIRDSGRQSTTNSSRSRSRSGSRSGSMIGDDDGPAPVIHPDSQTIPPQQLPASESSGSAETPKTEEPLAFSITPSSELPPLSDFGFIIIDDNVDILRKRLIQIRRQAEMRLKAMQAQMSTQATRSSPLGGKKRPSLAMHHRPKSSPAVRLMSNALMPPISIPGVIEEVSGDAEASGHAGSTPPGAPGAATSGGVAISAMAPAEGDFDPLQVVLVHFTSLSNYKLVQDTIQSTLYFSPSSADGYSMFSSPLSEVIPEILVIPKPAGPRRFLTALHTAVRKPCVDPFFAPIANSPMSPGPRMTQRYGSWAAAGDPTAGYSGSKRAGGSNSGNDGGGASGSGGLSSRLGAGVRQNSNGSNASGSGSISSSRSQGGHGAPTSTSPAIDRRSPRDHPVITEQQMHQTNYQAGVVPMTYGAHTERGHYAPYPPSPLATRENVEYFSASAALPPAAPIVGDSAGVLLHSPDGRPSGILFQPQQQQSRRTWSNGSNQSVEQRQTPQRGSRSGSFNNQPMSPIDALAVTGAGTLGTAPSSGRFRVSPAVETGPGTPGVQGPYISPTRPSATVRRSPSSVTGAGEDPGRPPMLRKSSNRPPILPGGAPGSAILAPRRRASTTESPSQTPSTDLPYQGRLKNKKSNAEGVPGGTRDRKPGSVSRRSSAEAREKAALVAPLKKGKGSDGAIVPPINVLIVEDNPINQTIMSTYLKRKKILTQTAKNGQEAVDKWRVGNFHLILMDIQMPVKNGIEATKEIRAIEKERNIGIFPSTPPLETVAVSKATGVPQTPYRSSVIIVALTASSLQSDRVAALAAGCNDFLTKPISMDWLNSKIIEWGSIKVLEMFQDPAAARLLSTQNARSKSIASALKLPASRTMSPSIPASATPALLPIRPSMPEPASSEESAHDSQYTDMPERPTLTLQPPSTPDVTTTTDLESGAPRASKEPVVEPIVEAMTPLSPDKTHLLGPPLFGPTEVSGADALQQHLVAAHKVESDLTVAALATRDVILGEGALSSHSSATSIESVMHGIPPIAEDAASTTPEPDEQLKEGVPAIPLSSPSAAPIDRSPGPYP
ncbi:ssk1 response regulator receiver [Tulasnella sp. 331]|nr:ssk1 response regulator receiver [Tulasnella sp. 331]